MLSYNRVTITISDFQLTFSVSLTPSFEQILDEQSKDKEITNLINIDGGVGKVTAGNKTTSGQTRQRLHLKKSGVEDIELQGSNVV